MIQLFHQRAKCIGCNACVEADKNRWRMSRKDGKCTLIGAKEKKGIYKMEIELDEWKNITKAIKNCPVKIIKAYKLK